MTEPEWLACNEFRDIWRPLARQASPRQVRLFWCACARRHWVALAEGPYRRAVEIAERFADGRASADELAAVSAAMEARERAREDEGPSAEVYFARVQARAAAWDDAAMRANWAGGLKQRGRQEYSPEAWARLALLRDIVGNPFRAIAVEPAWLAWNGGTVPTLARAIYDELAFDRLPILADALEDAGCDDDDLLAHCRAGGEHARGCRVIDALFKRE